MYEIYFHTKFSSTWFAGLPIISSSFTLFGRFESTKLNSIRKVLDGKVRNFSPTKISSFTVLLLHHGVEITNKSFLKCVVKEAIQSLELLG